MTQETFLGNFSIRAKDRLAQRNNKLFILLLYAYLNVLNITLRSN
jgi:hypothetical protein